MVGYGTEKAKFADSNNFIYMILSQNQETTSV